MFDTENSCICESDRSCHSTVSFFTDLSAQEESHNPKPSLVKPPIGISRQNCGKQVIKLVCKKCQKVHFRTYFCSNRFCVRCATERARVILAQVKEIINRQRLPYGYRWRLITLTLKKKSFKDAVPQAVKAWGKFYHNILEKNSLGTMAHLELAPGGVVHWHVLSACKFIAQADISAEWKRLTGDSFMTYIQDAHGFKSIMEVVSSITKLAEPGTQVISECSPDHAVVNYVLKPFKPTSEAQEKMMYAYYCVIKNVRVFRTYGIFYGRFKNVFKPPCSDCGGTEWKYLYMITYAEMSIELKEKLGIREAAA